MEVLEMIRGTRATPAFNPNVAAVIFSQGHYTLIVKRATSDDLDWYDSLAGPNGRPPSPETLGVIYGLRDLLAAQNIAAKNVTPQPCRRQQKNACGVEVIRNIGIQVFGHTNMSRDIIARAREAPDDSARTQVWKSAWSGSAGARTSDAGEKEKSSTKVIASWSNNPYEPGASETPPTKAICTKCARESLGNRLCAWHHPRCQQLIKCAKRNSNRRPCAEFALSAVGPDNKLRLQISACWYHATPHERRLIRDALENPDSTAQVTTKPKGTAALRHYDVRNIVLPFQPGQLITADVLVHGMGPRTTMIGTITGDPCTNFSHVLWKARTCTRCNGYHACDSAITHAIPASDSTYFEVRPASNTEQSVIAQDDMLPECEDLDDGSDIDDEDVPQDREMPAATDALLETTNDFPAYGTSGTRRLGDASKWFIFSGRPPHIPQIVWKQLSDATRSEHRRWLTRLKHAEPELTQQPLPLGALHLICRISREKHWRWSTLSSKISAAVKSALANLPIYTNCREAIDLGDHVLFAAAQSYAQRQARVESTQPLRARPITHTEYTDLARQLGHPARALLVASWWFAARTGDVRRLKPCNLNVDLQLVDEHGFVPAAALFTEGKGARFWGPYTIHTRLPLAEAKVLVEIRRDAIEQSNTYLFSTASQTAISKLIRLLPDASLRSIRRGALTWFAQAGVSDDHLQLLSGHQRRDTLLRYLEWGLRSSSAIEAAKHRTELIAGAGPAQNHPTYMGPHAGLNGASGQRVKPPVELFPRKPPSNEDLGISAHTDTSSWPLHVKPHVTPMDVLSLTQHVSSSDLQAALQHGIDYLHQPELLGATWAPLHPRSLPKTKFTADQWRTMHAGGKCIPLRLGPAMSIIPITEQGPQQSTVIRAACKGFPTPQHAKQRLRPVFEPMVNKSIDKSHRPPLRYPARRGPTSQKRDLPSTRPLRLSRRDHDIEYRQRAR
eukprot:PhM_4_TR16807/c1_g1_i2/m.52058